MIGKWKPFKLKDIFKTTTPKNNNSRIIFPSGKNVPISKNILKKGNTPRITVTKNNNGSIGNYSFPKLNKNISKTAINKIKKYKNSYVIKNNFISVSFLGTVFYHPKVASVDVRVYYLQPKMHTLNEYTGEFLVCVIRESVDKVNNFGFHNQLSDDILPNIKIKLPVSNNKINWKYIYNYMKVRFYKVDDKIYNLEQKLNKRNNIKIINTNDWHTFKLSDIFITKNKKNGTPKGFPAGAGCNRFLIHSNKDIPRISRTANNNSIIGKYSFNKDKVSFIIKRLKKIKSSTKNKKKIVKINKRIKYIKRLQKNYRIHKNFISVGALGNVFYQPQVVSLDTHIYCLKPRNIKLNYYIGEYLVTIIRKSLGKKYKGKFLNQLNNTILLNLKIKLPTNKDSNLNWKYMNNYMRDKILNAKNKLQSIRRKISNQENTNQINKCSNNLQSNKESFHYHQGNLFSDMK